MAAPKDISELYWNGQTVDVVSTVGTLRATDRAEKPLPAGAYKIGVLPAGAILTGVYISTVTGFDKAATIGVGDPTTAAKWAASAACKAVAVVVGTLGLNETSDVAQDIVATIDFKASTVGEVNVIFKYIDVASRREMFTA